MKQKYYFIIVLLIPLLVYVTYNFIDFLHYRNVISTLEQYTFRSNEKILKSFDIKDKKYTISIYYDDTSTWSHLNLLLNDDQKYYRLKSIKKCDSTIDGTNVYVKDNEIYIHCIGKNGNINKYLIDDFNVKNEILSFDYTYTPNISQIHITIDKIDNEFIYLSSPFKVDNTVDEKPKVKCSFDEMICYYY